MSTIVAVEKKRAVAIAWDSMFATGSVYSPNCVSPSKVVRLGNSFIGVAGFTVYATILGDYQAKRKAELGDESAILRFFVQFWRDLQSRYHLVNSQSDSSNPSPFADLDAEFLVVNPRGIFRVKEILSVSRFERFCAIGSGSEYAEGALSVLYDSDLPAAALAKRAVEVALQFDRASGGTVLAEELRGKRAPKGRAN